MSGSRFFATGSDSESETSSEEEPLPRQPAATYTFSDEEEETKRVVRSAKEKRNEDLMNIIKQIRNYKKIKDMSSMLSSFEELMRAYTKALPVINKEENGQTPRFYLRCLVEMDDFINEVWEDREGRKNMSKNNSKSLTSLRQKLRKYNKDFEIDIAKFRENPDQADEEEEEEKEQEGDSEPEDVKSNFKKAGSESSAAESKSTKKQVVDDEGSDDSLDWGSESETDSESSDDETQFATLRDRYLKRNTEKEEEDKKEKKEKNKEHKEKEKKQRREEEEDEGEWETVKGGVAIPSEKPKMFAKDAEIDVNLVVKKLNEIIAARGKKRTDRREQIELLHELQSVAEAHRLGPAVAIKIKFAIVSAIFDYNPKVSDAMKPEFWAKYKNQGVNVPILKLNFVGDYNHVLSLAGYSQSQILTEVFLQIPSVGGAIISP